MAFSTPDSTEVPPYQLQTLIDTVLDGSWSSSNSGQHVRCAQALGSEIYVGCSNGELLRFALPTHDTNTSGMNSYHLLSRQTMPNNKPIDEIVLAPSIARLLVLSDRQVFFYTLPTLDMIPANVIKPIRNVVTLAIDDRDSRRPPLSRSDVPQPVDPIEFCVIKRSSISIYTLKDRLLFVKDIPFSGATLARRTGRHLCVADQENYNMIDLEAASLFPLLPLSQVPDSGPIKPSITVISESEFLIVSWTGASTLGVFITGDGDPVRGTLEWSSLPISISFDYPYAMTLLPNETVEIHSIETQALVQVVKTNSIAHSPTNPGLSALIACANGFFVPSTQRSEKLRPTGVRLIRPKTQVKSKERAETETLDKEDLLQI